MDSAESSLWYYPNEGHLTKEGHRIVSNILAEALDMK